MKKILGIFGILVIVILATILLSDGKFLGAYNIENQLRWTALFGILSIGVAFVIITGGIDLSIGSVVCLVGCGLPWLLTVQKWPLPLALLTVLTTSLLIGFLHGLLITKLKLQPLRSNPLRLANVSRHHARIHSRSNPRIRLRIQRNSKDGKCRNPLAIHRRIRLPAPCLFLIVVATVAGIFLNQTIYGRYLLALGRNEEAARYSGINTDKMITMAYVICSFTAGLGGILFVMDVNSAQPSDFGNFYELYAIAAAVLGGCSLRGGYGTILGVVIGAALMRVLQNMIMLVEFIPTHIEFAVIGAVILFGVIADETVKRIASRRQPSSKHTSQK